MTEIDITDKVQFIESDDDDFTFFIKCVCGDIFPYPNNIYNESTRMLWECPKCGAKLYFRDSHEHGNRIIQVIE